MPSPMSPLTSSNVSWHMHTSRQIFRPGLLLAMPKMEAYICVDEFWRAALEPGRGVKVRWEEKGDLECCEIQGGMRTILLFWEIGLC